MRDIAALLFGEEPGDPRTPPEAHEPREACLPGSDTPAPAGDWCKTSPAEATLEWLGRTLRSGGRVRRVHTARTRTR
jgi:hypothetical protein